MASGALTEESVTTAPRGALTGPNPLEQSRFVDAGCRALDIAVSAALLVLLAPVLALIAVLVRLDSPGPSLFRQERVGKDQVPFMVNKFRTMQHGAAHDRHREFVLGLIKGEDPRNLQRGTPNTAAPVAQADGPAGRASAAAEREGEASEPEALLYKMMGDPRVTRLGRLLRRSSLDELPQLWNVLRGDMSLVGPRPPIAYEVEHYPPEWLARFAVKPGLTGLWQVSGRSSVTVEQMVRLDVEYARRRSLRLNISLIVRTVPAVLRARGAW